MQNAKGIFASWTIWFGICQIVLAGLGFMSGQMDQAASLALVTTGIGTLGLRFKTSQPII